jgi:murein hydrolase activator
LASSTAKTSKRGPLGKWRVRTLCAGALALGGAAMAQNLDDERRALARAKAQSIVAEERAQKLEALAAAQMSAAEAAKARAAAVASRVQAAESDIAAAESRIAIIERMRSDQRARLAEKQEPAVRLMAALQTLARRPPALALVQPGTVSDLAHVRAVLAGLIPQLRRKTASLRVEIEKSKALRADAGRALTGLEAAEARLSEQRAELLQIAAVRRGVAEQTQGSAMIEQDRAMAMGEKARDLVDLLDRVAEQGVVRDRLAELPGPTLRPAKPGIDGAAPTDVSPTQRASLPYRLPVSGTVVTGLGEVSSAGVRSRGLTLATRPQAQIVAPSAGTIVYAGKFGSYGNVVIIDHGRGWTSVVTSVAALDVQPGESVLQGSPIGRAGDDRPMITVELRQKNKPVDITRLLG